MRSFATILATISLPLYALAAHHGNHARDHGGVALRARGDLLPKRYSNAPFTYYDITVGQVACGGWYSPSDYVVALNRAQFGDVPGQSQYCGQSATITYNGKTVSVTIVDKCMGCGQNGLDLTEDLFILLAGSTAPGVIYGTWDFGSSGGGGGGGGGGGSPPKEQPTTTSTPEYTPPKPTSTTHYYSPSPIPHTTSTPPPPPPSSSSSTSTSETSSSASTTSMATSASQSHSSSPLASPSSSVVPYPSGVADPGGVVVNGQTNAIADIYNCISGLGQIILSS